MPRRARPWYRRGRRMFFFTFRGQQIPTGVTDPADVAGAQAAMERILADLVAAAATRLHHPPPPPPDTAPPADARTVAGAVADYLAACDRKVAAGKMTAKCRRDYARPLAVLAAELGARPLAGLTGEELERWAEAPRPAGDPGAAAWSASTQNTYLGTVQTMLRWCRVALPVRRPHKESRGADVVLTDDQFALVLAAAVRGKYAGDLRELLRVLRETGARPQEVARLTAADVDWENCCTRLRKHKTAKKTGRDRVIHFPASAMAVMRALRDRYGAGLLFRSRGGGAYTAGTIVRRMGQVSKRVGFRVIAYGLGRHSFATRALSKGVPDAIVAELLGHRGTAMLAFHYSHLGTQARALKDAAEKVSRAG